MQVLDADIDELNDSISLEPYEDPQVLTPCGHTVSGKFIPNLRLCPLCNSEITSHVPNIALRHVFEAKGTPISEVYELILLDVSSSMWYSDRPGPFSLIMGKSRLDVARKFITTLINHRKDDSSQLMGLVTFGTNITRLCELARPKEVLRSLKSPQPTEKHTRVYDAVIECIRELEDEKYNNFERRLHIFTDGADNLSSSESSDEVRKNIKNIRDLAKSLHVLTVVFNVGGNVDKAKSLADSLGAIFKDISESKVLEMGKQFCTVEYPNRAESIARILLRAPSVSNVKLPSNCVVAPANSVRSHTTVVLKHEKVNVACN